MQEITGDLFDQDADAICILTNGIVNKDGANVMGAGCALEARKRFPSLPILLGSYLRDGGNHVWTTTLQDAQGPHLPALDRPLYPRYDVPYHIVTFPTKNHWRNKSDLLLIGRSASELVGLANIMEWEKVVLPRPGCGLGGLSWDKEVRPLLTKILDDRFYAVTFE